MTMKKYLLLILLTLFSLCACSDRAAEIAAIIDAEAYQPEPVHERKNLKLGVVSGPYGDMFMEMILPLLAPKGYNVELVVYDDFVKPNIALANHEVDLNMFQHYRYLNNFKLEHNLDLSAVTEIPTVSMAVFSSKYTTLEDIENDAVALIPDDATNMARALQVLDASGVVTIDPYADKSKATAEDLSKNSYNIQFSPIPANQLVQELPNSDLAVINGNFAYAGGLNLSDALYREVLQEGLVNLIAVRTEDLGLQFVRDIMGVVHSDEFRNSIISEGSKYSGFQRPRHFSR